MPIATIAENDRKERFIATAGQTVFPYDFPIYAATDLQVRRERAGVITLLTLGTDYSVTGVLNQTGGNVVLTTGANAGDIIVILSAMSTARATQFVNGGDLAAAALEAELNRIRILFQQNNRDGRNALLFPPTDPAMQDLPPLAQRANRFLAFDANGQPIAANPIAGTVLDAVSRLGDNMIGFLGFLPGTANAPGLRPNNDNASGFFSGPNLIGVSVNGSQAERFIPGGMEFLQTGAGATSRTAKAKMREIVSVMDFGAIGNGIADDAPAFQAAINALPASGGSIIVPPGTYKWNSTVTIGDGTASSASTKNNIQLIGSGGGFTTSESLAAPIQAATRIKWGGALGGTMLQIFGPISGGQLSGMMFDCSALANTAIYMMHPYTWDFSDIVVTEWRGEAWQWLARNNAPSFGVYTGSCDNTLTRIRIAGGATATNNACMVVGTASGAPGDLDVCRNTFDTCVFIAPDGATNSSFVARFCDLLSFYQCFLYSPGAGLAATLRVLPPTGLTMFPSGLAFYNCSLHRKPLIDPTWNPPDVNSNGQNSGIHFYPYSSDLINEEPDYSKGIHGFTHNGMAIAKRQMKLQKGSDISETAVVVSRAVVPVTVSNTVTQTNIYSYVVPAGMVTADRRLRLKLHGVYLNNSGANRDVLFRVFLGASLALEILITGLPSSANPRAWALQVDITAQNSVTTQFAEGEFKMGAASASGVFAAPQTVFTGGNDILAVNMANAQTLAVAISHSTAAPTISATMRGAVLELL